MKQSGEITRFDGCLIDAANELSHREYWRIDKLIELADTTEAVNTLEAIQTTYLELVRETN